MSLIYIQDNKFFKKVDNDIVKLEKLEVSSKDIITSAIGVKDVITFTFKLPKSTPKEELKAQAEVQFYEQAGLDLNKQFKSFYLIKELPKEDNYLVEAIAIDEETLHTKFGEVVEKVGFIDFISLLTLTFSEFYEIYQKETKRDAFVYLDNNRSFIAVYENGEYVYSKTLNSLSSLLKTIGMDYDKFIEIVSSKGLNKDLYETEEFLIASEIDRFFTDYFMAVNNRLAYGQNVFYLDAIENIYFYTPFKIEGQEVLHEFWEHMNVNFEIIPIEEINFLDKLAIFYNEKHYKDEINFSIFPRPPKFYQTRTFGLFMIILVTILGFGGHFYYIYSQNQLLEAKVNKLKKEVKIKKAKLTKLKAINKVTLNKLNEYNKQISAIKNDLKHIKTILEKSIEIVNSPKTTKDYVTFSNLLHKNKLQTFVISKEFNNSFEIGVYTKAQNRQNIGLFMDDLVKAGYQDVLTDEITQINDTYYMSTIRFRR